MRAVAIVLGFALVSCALAHERDGRDASAPNDAQVTACAAYWRSLPSCPAFAADAVGRPCAIEGATCGMDCCDPPFAIRCERGHWLSTTRTIDCTGVRCDAPSACGAGSCAPDRTCVHDTLAPEPQPVCAAVSWRAWPVGSLDADSNACVHCIARGPSIPNTIDLVPYTPPFGTCR